MEYYRNKMVDSGNDLRLLCTFIFQLMQIMIKVSDVSNEARPMEVAEPWLDCLLQEFFIQVRSFCNNIFKMRSFSFFFFACKRVQIVC